MYYRNGTLPPLTPVVKNLIIANVFVFFVQLTFKQSGLFDLESVLARHHVLSPDFKLWQLITALFCHSSFGHLLGNMFGIYLFGTWLEDVWGGKRFLKFYLICGISAGIFSLLAMYLETYSSLSLINNFLETPTYAKFSDLYNNSVFLQSEAIDFFKTEWAKNTNNPQMTGQAYDLVYSVKTLITSGIALGASGALFGLIAGSAYLFPNDTVYVQFLIPIKIKWLALFYGVGELYLALLNNPQDQVGHVAHLGGGLVGFVLVYYWNKTNRRNFY